MALGNPPLFGGIGLDVNQSQLYRTAIENWSVAE